MSVLARDLANEAASLVGDPDLRRISIGQWRTILNRVQREMATRIHLLEADATFDLTTDDRYSFPDDAVQLINVKVVDTQADAGDRTKYRFLNELRGEEFRANTDAQYPVGSPTHYYPRQGWYHLWPKPQTAITDGGLAAYWFRPADFADLDTEQTEFPDFFIGHVVDGMVVEGLRVLKQFREAAEYEQRWMAREPDIVARAEDRSDDRRASFRPRIVGTLGDQV